MDKKHSYDLLKDRLGDRNAFQIANFIRGLVYLDFIRRAMHPKAITVGDLARFEKNILKRYYLSLIIQTLGVLIVGFIIARVIR